MSGQRSAARVDTRVDGPVAELSFDTGLPGNALTLSVIGELQAAVGRFAANPPRVLVVRGRATSFTAGADINELKDASPAAFRHYVDEEYRLFGSIENLPCITIAAVAGPVIGNGAEMALAFDFRIATGPIRFGFPEVKAGVFGPSGRLSRYVGIGAARDLLLTGRVIDADEALAMGLITAIEDDDVTAESFAASFAGVAPISVRLTKRNINAAYDIPSFDDQVSERDAADELFATSDAREGLAAAAAGRAPTFEGR